MVSNIKEMALMTLYFGILCFWLLKEYPRMIHLQWIMMIVWMPIGVSVINDLVVEGMFIYLHLALLLLIEYMAFSHLLQNYQDSKKKSKIVSAI